MPMMPKKEQMNANRDERAPGGESAVDPRAVPEIEDDRSAFSDEPTETADSAVRSQTPDPADGERRARNDATLDTDEDIYEEDEEEESPTKAL